MPSCLESSWAEIPQLEKRALGSSGLTVPVIGVGTWRTFDVRGEAAAKSARDRVDEALGVRANFFDSSPMYGQAEKVLGDALKGRRDEALVATKVWASTDLEGEAQVKRALAWFGGRIDLYQVHNLLAWRTHLPRLEKLRDEGAVSAVGATHWDPSAFDELAVVMRPFAEGELMRRPPASAELAPLAEFGVTTWAQALLKWILSDQRCHVAIPATSRLARTLENAKAGQPPWFGKKERDLVSRLAIR